MKVRARPGAPTTCCTSVLRRVLPISPSRRRSIHTITLGLRAACHRNAFFLFTAHKNTPYLHTPQRSPIAPMSWLFAPLPRTAPSTQSNPPTRGAPNSRCRLQLPHHTPTLSLSPPKIRQENESCPFFSNEHRKQACSPVYELSVLVRSRCTETKEHLRRCPPPTSLRSACLTRMRCLFPFQPIFLLGGNGIRGKHITDDQRLLHILSFVCITPLPLNTIANSRLAGCSLHLFG
jgi:hypothetical protein